MNVSNKQLITIYSDLGISIYDVYIKKDGVSTLWLHRANGELAADIAISNFKLKYRRTDCKGVKCYKLITNKEDV